MIKQFNFYDIYGYLLPGLLLMGVLRLPVCLLTGQWPDVDISKALLLVVLAYVLGHLVNIVGAQAVPSEVQDAGSHHRALSEYLMDAEETTFSSEFKKTVETLVQDIFKLGLQVEKSSDGEDPVAKDRQTAFKQARAYLVAKKTATYVEQFQGMYVMVRGLGCVLCVGAVYVAGWRMAFYRGGCAVQGAMWIVGGTTLLCLPLRMGQLFLKTGAKKSKSVEGDRKKAAQEEKVWRIATTAMWIGGFFAAGYWVGILNPLTRSPKPSWPMGLEFLAAAMVMLTAALMFLSSYRQFTRHFAETVWRDFSASISAGSKATAAATEGDGGVDAGADDE